MEYKINNFNLADISFDDAKSLSEYFEKSIFKQNIQYLLIGPNIINFKYSNEKKNQAEENKKIMNTLCRLVLHNLGIKPEQTVVMQTTSNLSAKSYMKKICKDLNVLINEKTKKENFSEISKLLLYFDYISFFTTLKDDFNDEISICDFIIKMFYSEGELFFDSIETLHENFGIICEKAEKFNNLNIFYMLMYNLPLDHLGSFLLCDKTKEYFNVFSEQIEVEDFIKRYIFINQFSLLQNKTQFENFVQSESNVDKIRNEYENYKNLYSSFNKIKNFLGINAEEERKIFELFFAILLVSEYDIFEDSKAKNIIEKVTKNSKQVDTVSIIRSCLFSDFKFRINSKSKIFEKKNDENINILQKIALNLNVSEDKIVFILLTDIQNERIKSNRQDMGRIRNEFIKTIYEIFLDKIKILIKSGDLGNNQENEHKPRTNNRLSFLIARANQVYISSYISSLTFSKSNLPCEASTNNSHDYRQADSLLSTSRDRNEPCIIMIGKSIRETIYSNYMQELKNFLFFKNAVNISSSLKESSTIKIEYNNNFVNKLVNDIYNYKQLMELYENNAIGLLLLIKDCAHLPIFIHQFRTKFYKSNVIELYDTRYLKVKHTFGTFLYDLTELFQETASWNHVRTTLKSTIYQFLDYSPKNQIEDGVSELKRLANEVVYMNFLIKVHKYTIKDVIDDFKIGNIYFFYNNFFNYNLDMSEIRKNLLKNAKNQFENSKLLKNDYILFKSQIAKKFRISELDYYHENGFVFARKNFSRVLDFNKNIANLIFKYNHRMFYYLAVKNVLSSNYSPLRFAINTVRVYLGLVKIYKEKKIFITVKNLILDQIIEQFSIKRDSGETALIHEINKRQELKLDLSLENFSIILPKLFTYLTHLNNIWKNYFADIVFLEINRTNFTNSNNIDMIIKERFTNLKILLFLFSKNYKFINADNLRKNGILHFAFIKNISEEILNLMQQLHESFKALLMSNDIICITIEKNLSLEKLISKRLSITQPKRLHSTSMYMLDNDIKSCNGFTYINSDNAYNSSKINQSNSTDFNSTYSRSIYPNALNADSSNALTNLDRKTVCLRRLSNKIKIIIDDDLYHMLGKSSLSVRESYKVNIKEGLKLECDYLMNLHDVKGIDEKSDKEKNKNTVEIINELLEERTGNKSEKPKHGFSGIDSKILQAKILKIEKEILEVNIKERNQEIFNISKTEILEVNIKERNQELFNISKKESEKASNNMTAKANKEKQITSILIKDNEKIVENAVTENTVIKKDENKVTIVQKHPVIEDVKYKNNNIEKLDASKKENVRNQPDLVISIIENKALNFINFFNQENQKENLDEPVEEEEEDIFNTTIRKNDLKIKIVERTETEPNKDIIIDENPLNRSIDDDNCVDEEEKESKPLITFDNNVLNEIILDENSNDIGKLSLKFEKDNYRYESVEREFQSTDKDRKNNNEYNASSKSLSSSNDSKISGKSITIDNQCLNKEQAEIYNNNNNYKDNDLQSQSIKYDSKVNYSDGNLKMEKIKWLMELKLEDYQDFMSEPHGGELLKNEANEEVDETMELDNIVEVDPGVNETLRENSEEVDQGVDDKIREISEDVDSGVYDKIREKSEEVDPGVYDKIREKSEEVDPGVYDKIREISEDVDVEMKKAKTKDNEIKLVANVDEIADGKFKEFKERVHSNSSKYINIDNKIKKVEDNKLSLEKILENKNNLYRNKMLARKVEKKTKEEDELNQNNLLEENLDIKPIKKHEQKLDVKPANIEEKMPVIIPHNINEEEIGIKLNKIDQEIIELKPRKIEKEKPDIKANNIDEGKKELKLINIHQEKIELKLNKINEEKIELKMNKIKEEKNEKKNKEIHEDNTHFNQNKIKEEKRNEEKIELKMNKINEEKPDFNPNKFNKQKHDIKHKKIKEEKDDIKPNKIKEEKPEFIQNKIQEEKHDIASLKVQEEVHDYNENISEEEMPDYNQNISGEEMRNYNQNNSEEQMPDYNQSISEEEMSDCNQNNSQKKIPEYNQNNSEKEMPNYMQNNSEEEMPEYRKNNSDKVMPEYRKNNSEKVMPDYNQHYSDSNPDYNPNNSEDSNPDYNSNYPEEVMHDYNQNISEEEMPDYNPNNSEDSNPDYNPNNSKEVMSDCNRNNLEDSKQDFNSNNSEEEKFELKLHIIKKEKLRSKLHKINEIPDFISNKLDQKVHDPIPITNNEKIKIKPNRQENKLHLKQKKIQNELLDVESNKILNEKHDNKQNHVQKAKFNLNPNKILGDMLESKQDEVHDQKKDSREVEVTARTEDISTNKLKKEDINLKNEKYDVMVEETLENILKDNLLDEFEDNSKDIEYFGDEEIPEKELTEKLENKHRDKSEPLIEIIEEKLPIKIIEHDKRKEDHVVQSEEKREDELASKLKGNLDDKVRATLDSIPLESIKEEIQEHENKVVLKSQENFSELKLDEKFIDGLNGRVEDDVIKRLEDAGKGKERKNSKKIINKQIEESLLEKLEDLEDKEEKENSKEILQNLDYQIVEITTGKICERLANKVEAIGNENHKKNLEEDLPKTRNEKRKKTIEEKLETTFDKKLKDRTNSQESQIFTKKDDDFSERKLKTIGDEVKKKEEKLCEEILEKPEINDHENPQINDYENPDRNIENQSDEFNGIDNKQDNIEDKINNIKNNLSNPNLKISENLEFNSKITKEIAVLDNNNDDNNNPGKDDNTKRRTHRKVNTTKIRVKKGLSLGEIDPESLNLNDEDYNNIIPKQSADLSLIYLDLNNHIMSNFESDLTTPTFVKLIGNKINYNRNKEEEIEQMELDVDINKDLDVSFKKETEDELDQNPANMNYSQYFSSLRSKCQEVVYEVEPEYEAEAIYENEDEAQAGEEEEEEPTLIRLDQLHELDRQMKLLKANLNELNFLNYVTETTSEMFIMQEELADKAIFHVPNEERGNFKLYSDILGELQAVITDFPEVLKY